MIIETGSNRDSLRAGEAEGLEREFQNTARDLGRKLGRRVVQAGHYRNVPIKAPVVVGSDTRKGYSIKENLTVYADSATSDSGEIRKRASKAKGIPATVVEVVWFEDIGAFFTAEGKHAWDTYGDDRRAQDEERRQRREEAEGNRAERLAKRYLGMSPEDQAEFRRLAGL